MLCVVFVGLWSLSLGNLFALGLQFHGREVADNTVTLTVYFIKDTLYSTTKNKMIEGKLISKIDSNLNSYLLCSTFIETDSRSNQSTIAANSLYQFINSEQELGVLIGSNEGRSLVLVFTNLEKSDFYQNIAAVYLFSMHIPIEICCQNIAEVMKIHGSNVSSLILIELNQRYFISCLEAGSNIHVLHLKEDQYLIR